MSSFPGGDEIIRSYLDQREALERLLREHAALFGDPSSRFHGLAEAAIQARVEMDLEEVALWAVMMLVASFEATLRADAQARIGARTRDPVRKPLRELFEEHGGRVRLDDIRAVWETHVAVGATIEQEVARLLKHRHWLAHGRHWSNKYGVMPEPHDAHAALDDYLQALRAAVADFPRML